MTNRSLATAKVATAAFAAITTLSLADISPALAADAFVPQAVPEPVLAPVASRRSVLIGLGAAVAPAYEGSDQYRVAPFPILSPDLGGDGPRRFEFRALDDIRVHLVRFGGLSAGPSGGYTFGRDEDVDDRLLGLGDVDGGLVVGGFASYAVIDNGLANLSLDVGVSTQITGDAFEEDRFTGLPNLRDRFDLDYGYGYEIDVGASVETQLSDRLNLAGRVGATYADDAYMRTFFGVSTLQAANSARLGQGLAAFAADEGVKSAYVRSSATLDVTPSIQLRGGLGYARLLDDAADSPVTADENQFSGDVGAAYRIDF